MRVIILGSGTSDGIPIIGCDCPVCTSDNPRDRRLRSSIFVEINDAKILIDASIDLRQQALDNNISHLDAVLFTHYHADHVNGIDDLRRFNQLREGEKIPCYVDEKTITEISRKFPYVFTDEETGGGKPKIVNRLIDSPFLINSVTVIPVPVLHGQMTILGFRIGNMAYLTDCSGIPPKSMQKLGGLDLLIIDALKREPHPTHFCLSQAMETANILKPRRTLFTHICHKMGHKETNAELPRDKQLAYDGQIVEL
jgi:phosphoribosyl 1,2-cyclic phosphate phosphodiesterase